MPLAINGHRGMAYQNAGNGRLTWVWKNGNPVFDDGLVDRIMSLLVEQEWWADRARRRHSQLLDVHEDDERTKSRLEQYALDALDSLIGEGAVRNVAPEASRDINGRWSLLIRYSTAAGPQKPLDVPISV